MIYNWQKDDWTNFKYYLTEIEDVLLTLAKKIDRSRGLLEGLPKNIQAETLIEIMVSEAVKTSKTEWEYLSRCDVLNP